MAEEHSRGEPFRRSFPPVDELTRLLTNRNARCARFASFFSPSAPSHLLDRHLMRSRASVGRSRALLVSQSLFPRRRRWLNTSHVHSLQQAHRHHFEVYARCPRCAVPLQGGRRQVVRLGSPACDLAWPALTHQSPPSQQAFHQHILLRHRSTPHQVVFCLPSVPPPDRRFGLWHSRPRRHRECEARALGGR